MTKRAQLPDGRILEFPDDTPDAVVQRVVREQLGLTEPASPSTPAPTPARTPTPTPTRTRTPAEPQAEDDLPSTRARVEEQLRRARERRASQQALLEDPVGRGVDPMAYQGIISSVEEADTTIAALERSLAYMEREGRAPPAATVGSTLSDVVRGIPRGAISSVGQGISGIEGLIGSGLEAAGAERVGRAFSEEAVDTENWWNRAAEAVAGTRSEAAQYSPRAALAADIGEGLGSTVPYLLTEGAGAAASRVGAAGRAALAAGEVPTAMRVARGAGYGLGAGQGSAQAGQMVQQFREEGGVVSPGREFVARLGGVGLGLTEVGVVSRMIERLPSAARQNAINAVYNVVERATLGRVAPRETLAAIQRTIANIEARGAGRIALSAAEEAGQEAFSQLGQNVLARGLYDPNQAIFEDVGYNALIGAIAGGTIRGGTEAVRAVSRRTGAPQSEVNAAIQQEFRQLAAREVAAVMAANPEMRQNDAVNVVMENSEQLLIRAATNVASRIEGGADATAGAGVDVVGGGERGVGTDRGPVPPATDAEVTGETVGGGLERTVPSVPVPDVGARAGEPALAPITAAQVKAVVPTITQTFEANASDFEDSYGVKKLNAEQKKQAARIILQSPEVDPYDAIGSVLERGERLRGAEGATTTMEVGGRKRTIKTPATPAGVAQLATELGVAPETQAAPSIPPEYQAATDLLTAVDAGGIPFNPRKVNDIAGRLGLDVSRSAKPEDTIERIRAAVARYTPTVAETATAEKVTPSSTGIAEGFNQFSGSISENLRAALLAKVEAGEVSETGGQPSPVLQAAKLIKDAGVSVDAPMLERISMAVDDARQTGNFQAAMRAFVADTVQRAQPAPTAAPTVTPAPTAKPTKKAFQAAKSSLQAAIQADPRKPVPTTQQRNAMVSRLAEVGATPENIQAEINTFLQENPTQVGKGAVRTEEAPAPAPAPEYTPQQRMELYARVLAFASQEARGRGFDPDMFTVGARDVMTGRELLTDQQILATPQGQEALDAYKAGTQFAQDRVAEARATPTAAPTAAPTQAATVPAARAPRKAKVVGTKGANRKKLKKVLDAAPGKTVAEKVYNIAKAEQETLSEEELIEQSNLSPYTSNYETIRAKPGVNVRRMAKLLDSSLYGDPSDMGKVCIKEIFQNAFDATRTAVNNGQVAQGKININISGDSRTVRMTDNGVGMLPETLGGKFLEIAGTGKEGDKNAGGFGIAKMMFLYQNKNIRVITARDGQVSELNTTGEQLSDALENTDNAPDINVRSFEFSDFNMFPEGHGTVIELTLPDEIAGHKIYNLPVTLGGNLAVSLSPLFSNIDVDITYDNYPLSPDRPDTGSRFPVQDYTQFVGVKFPWGTAKVYVSRQPTGATGNNMHILSNGLWQFSKRVNKDPSDPYADSVPYTFYVDIVPSVKPEEFGYPFNFNRQNFTDDATRDFNKVKAFIDAIYAYNSMAGDVVSFGNIQYFDASGNLTTPVDLMPQIPVQDTAFTAVGQGDQITLSSDGSLLVNGQPMPELTPDQLKAGIPSVKELKVDPALIDTNAVMVHDNADVVVKSTGEKLPISEFMRRQFGARFDEFMRYSGDTFMTLRNEVARVMGYNGLLNEAIGVSLDPGYRGVSTRLPFSGSFINPLVPQYADGLRAGYGIFGTMVHELAHFKVRSHNADFPAEMQDILLNMEADTGFNFQRFKNNFAEDVSDKYGDIVEMGVELFNGQNPDIRIEYRGNRFKDGSQESTSDGTGDGGIGDVRGPSGERGTGEPVLGTAYESREGAGERGQPEGSTGGGTTPEAVEELDKLATVKLTKAQIKRLETAAGLRAGKMSKMEERIVRSRKGGETADLAGKLMLLSRDKDSDVNLLTSLYDSVPPRVFQFILGALMTEDVVRLGTRAGLVTPQRIDELMRDGYMPYVNRLIRRGEKVSTMWADFASRFPEGAEALADVMFVANMFDVDPVLAPTATDYMKIDPKLQTLLAEQAATTDKKRLKALKGQITERRGEITKVYNKTADADGNVVFGWKDLSRADFGGGIAKQIFRMARDEHRFILNEHYRLLMDRIDNSGFDEDRATELKDAISEMFDKARERAIYFPVRRFGNYLVSVGKGGRGGFYLKESYLGARALAQRLKREGETADIVVGDKRNKLRDAVTSSDAGKALKNIFDLIEGGTVDDMDMLKDNIFQMYLTALPEADMRRRFIHREFVTGFSTDVLRAYSSTAVASANQLGRLAYKYKFDQLFEEAETEAEGNPSSARLMTIPVELERRVQGIMSPPEDNWVDWLNSIGSKATFYLLLSAPKTAFVNLTQLPIVGLPTLSAEFGEPAAYAMAARYTGTFLTTERIAYPFMDRDGNVSLQMPRISLQRSRYISGLRETDPDRYAAFMEAQQYMDEHEVAESTYASGTGIYELSRGPTDTFTVMQSLRKGKPISAARRATANAINAMGALFHGTERINREIMFFSAFELAYERALKEGKTAAEATPEAIRLANKMTNDAMFDFSGWNKSRASKSRLGRLPLQMSSYKLQMTSLLFRSFVRMLPFMNKEGKLAAARVFFGVGAMTTVFAGIRASQFYTLAMLGYGLYEFVKGLADDDEEDKEQEVAQGYVNPETVERELLKYADEHGHELGYKDMDYYIRAEWIPETFGAGGTLATRFNIPDSVATKLEAVADMGLPAVAGVDISNSVSLGDLWHMSDVRSDDPEAAFFERLGRLIGPVGAIPSRGLRAANEFNQGNFERGFEALSPAILSNYLKSERFQEEGLVIGANRDIVLKEPDFYDTYTSTMQALGFAEAETSRNMQLDMQAADIEDEISAARSQLITDRYRAARALEQNPSDETIRELSEVERAIDIYNLNFPSNSIGAETLSRSYEERAEDAASKEYGLGMDQNIPIRQPLYEERLRRVVEEGQ